MPLPTQVPAGETSRGFPWTQRINFAVDITGCTFVATLSDKDHTMTVDHSHLAAGYIVLGLDAEATAGIRGSYVEWELSESPIWSQALIRRTLTFQSSV